MIDDPSERLRAVICDVYGTLLQVGPPPENADELWESGCRAFADGWMPLREFNARCASMVESMNDKSRAGGEPYPEVDWLELIRTLMLRQGLDAAVAAARAPLLSDWHARCCRTCTAMPGAPAVLERLRVSGIVVGLASNGQDYTLDELERAGISLTQFHPDLCFLSGEHGFAKPSPRVFELLTGKLASLGIAPGETLLIGDSVEKDIRPASAAGWQTWLIDSENPERTWGLIAERLDGSRPSR